MRKRRLYKMFSVSCILVLCMMSALLFTVFQAKAEAEKNVKYISDVTYNEGEIPTEAGYLFAGYYTSETGENYQVVAKPEAGKPYYAKFVPKEVLTIKAQVSSTLFDDKEENDKTAAIRLITSIDKSLDYRQVGFSIKKGSNGTAADAEVTNSVYRTLYAVGATDTSGEPEKFTPEDLIHPTSHYFKTWTITNIGEDAYNTDVTVTPYWITMDGTRVWGTMSIKSVNLGRSWVYVNSVANQDGEQYGTKKHPFTTLDAALTTVNAVDLNQGKVTLLSDITVENALKINNAEKTITIQSGAADNRKKITSNVNGSDTGLFDVSGKLTLKDLNITGGHNAIKNNKSSVVNAENVEIKDIQGNGIYHGGGTFTGKNMTIDTVIKNGVYIGGGEATLNNVTIKNVIGGDEYTEEGETKYHKRDGIYCDGGKLTVENGITIQDLTNDYSRSGIHMAEGTLNADRVTIENVKGPGVYVDKKNGDLFQDLFGEAAALNVDELTINKAEEEGLVVEDTAKATVGKLNISGENTTTRGIYMLNEATLTITDESSVQGTTQQGVYLLGESKITVNEKLTVKNTGSQGIYLDNKTQAEINGLEVSGTGSQAFLLEDEAHAIVSNFVITGSEGVGLRCLDETTVIATDGTIHAGKNYGVYLGGNSGVKETDERTFEASSNVTATNVTVDRSESNEKTLIVICKGTTFTLDEEGTGTSSIDGKKANFTGRGVEVQGTFNLKGGTIKNHKIDANTQGTLGELKTETDNKTGKSDGAAVYVVADGMFNMTGGNISGNKVSNAGAAVAIYGTDAVFNLQGTGVIGTTVEAEKATAKNEAVYGAVMVRSGNFNMNGGTIAGNTATTSGGGVTVSKGTFTMNDGEISDNTAKTGGGIYMNDTGVISLDGGVIQKNNATTSTDKNGGGGICIDKGTCNVNTGALITDNKSTKDGGGVSVKGGTFTLAGGTISSNTATAGGGGVSVNGSTASIAINSGNISENTGQNGHGMMIRACQEATMTGGSITTNQKTSGNGGGIYLISGVTFTMNGGNIIDNKASDGGAIFAANGSTINFGGGTISGNETSSTTDPTKKGIYGKGTINYTNGKSETDIADGVSGLTTGTSN